MHSDENAIPISIYADWLDIPADRCPPDHYTLLGLAPAESDRNVIKAAVLSRSAAVRRQSLKQPDLVKALLNQIAQAKNCLTDPQKAREYAIAIAIGIKATGTTRPDEELVARQALPPLPASAVTPPAAEALPISSGEPAANSRASGLNWLKSEPAWTAGKTGALVGPSVTAPRGAIGRIDRVLAIVAGEGNFILHNFFRVLLVFGVGLGVVLPIGIIISRLSAWRDVTEPGESVSSPDDSAPAEYRRVRVNPPAVAAPIGLSRSPSPAEYQVSVDPPQAEVRVTGRGASISGSGSSRRITVAGADGQAKVRIVAALSGYESDEQELQPQPGQSDRLKLRLTPLPALEENTVDLGNGVTLPMLLVPAGSFLMGDAKGDSNERPVHKVAITKAFYLGKYEVTQQQWEAVMGTNPSHFKGADKPVEKMSWYECQVFLRKLNALDGRGWRYSLPTEAQWEYGCRAGSRTRYGFGDDEASLGDVAWFRENSGRQTQPVGQKKPNGWGFYDMHGNVFEWCADGYDAGYYSSSSVDDPRSPATTLHPVIRGGSWLGDAGSCRSAYRYTFKARERHYVLGFRVAAVPSSE